MYNSVLSLSLNCIYEKLTFFFIISNAIWLAFLFLFFRLFFIAWWYVHSMYYYKIRRRRRKKQNENKTNLFLLSFYWSISCCVYSFLSFGFLFHNILLGRKKNNLSKTALFTPFELVSCFCVFFFSFLI